MGEGETFSPPEPWAFYIKQPKKMMKPVEIAKKELVSPVKAGMNVRDWTRELLPRSRGFCAIEFDRHVLKMMLVNGRTSKERVRFLKVKFLSSEKDDEMLMFLREFISDTKVPTGTHVTISIPQNVVHLKLQRYPGQDPEELQKMIAYRIQEDIPLPVQQIVYDYKVVEQEADGYSRVIVALARESDIQRYIELCQQVGLIVDAVRVNIEMIFQSFIHFFAISATLPDACFILVDVDFSATNVLVVHHGEMRFCRSVSKGVATLIDQVQEAERSSMFESWIDDLSENIEQTIAIAKNETELMDISSVVVTGWLPRKEILIEKLCNNLNMQVEWFDPLIPLKHFSQTGDDAIFHHWFSISALLGMVQARHQDSMDLRPVESRQQGKKQAQIRQIVYSALLFLYIVGVLIGGLTFARNQRQAVILHLQAALNELKPRMALVKKKQYVEKVLKKQLGGEDLAATLMAKLMENLPPRVRINSLTFIRGEQFLLRGKASNMSDVFILSEKLSKQPEFREAVISNADRRMKAMSSETIEFEMKIRFQQ